MDPADHPTRTAVQELTDAVNRAAAGQERLLAQMTSLEQRTAELWRITAEYLTALKALLDAVDSVRKKPWWR